VGRLLALQLYKKIGGKIPKLPACRIEARNEADAKQKLLRLNSRYGIIDFDGMSEFVNDMEINIDDLALPDINIDDLKVLLTGEEGTKADDELPEDILVISKLGDLWELNNHRILCGDSTDAEQVGKLMAGEKADMVFTDPPYGMFLDADYSSMEGIGKGNKYSNVKGDHKDFNPELINSIFINFSYCREIFLWGADYYAELIPKRNKGCFIVWDKMKGGEGANDKYDKMFGSNFELCWSKTRHKRAIARVLWKGIFGLEKEHDHKRHHPTQKPTELVLWFLDKFSKNNKPITDPFLGSGSTLIACEKTDRICYGMEIEPHYVDVSVRRWIDWCKQNNRAIKIKLNGKIVKEDILINK